MPLVPRAAALLRRQLARIALVLMTFVLAWQASVSAGRLPAGFGDLHWESQVAKLPDARKLA
jgi:hypothetical protein